LGIYIGMDRECPRNRQESRASLYPDGFSLKF